MTLIVLDGAGNQQKLSTSPGALAGELVGSTAVSDPVTGAKQTVAQLHNADQQTVPGAANSSLSVGTAQLQDAVSGLVNRQREIGQDNISPLGVVSGGTNMAMQFKTTCAQNLSSSVTTMTLANVTGTIGGVTWSIKQGSKLIIDQGASQEILAVASVNTSTKVVTFTSATAFAHNGSVAPFTLVGMTYNQARDASGENDGATGSGTAIAAEYEYNGGDPSGGNFDRARSINAKGLTTQTISGGGGVGSSSLTLTANTGLQPGMKVLLYKAATLPAAGSFESVNIDLGYVPGTNTVPLASPIVLSPTYDTIAYDSFAALGPQLNGFLPFGIGVETEAIFDPVTGKFFVHRQAPGAPGVLQVSSDGVKAAYRYCLLAFAMVAAPTDAFIIQGSATKTIRIKRIKLSGVATGQGNMPVQLVRRSTAGTIGAAVLTAITAAKHDPGDGAASVTVSSVGTANFTTPGTSAGIEGVGRLNMPPVTTGALTQDLVWDFSTRQDKAMILRGTADFLCINFNGAAIPAGGVVDLEIEIEEDNS